MINRALTAALLASLLVFPALAQDDEESPKRLKRGDELEERIPAVSGHLFLKAGRHEIAPMANLTLADPFRQKLIAGVSYTYHLNEYFAGSARFGVTSVSWGSGAVQVCPTPDECDGLGGGQLDQLPGNVTFFGTASVELSPLYGKLNFIAETVLHFDIYLTAGIGAVGYTIDGGSGVSPGFPIGVGQRFFVNEWFAVRLEWLDLLYFQPTSKKGSALRNQMVFTLGASLFFPSSFAPRVVQ